MSDRSKVPDWAAEVRLSEIVPTADDWEVDRPLSKSQRDWVENRGGVRFFDAPIPPRRHSCTPQSRKHIDWFYFLERCACGGVRYEGRGSWDWRNTRKDAQPDPAPVLGPSRRRWWQAWRRNDG